MIPWTMDGLHDLDSFMGYAVNSKRLGKVLPVLHAEAKAEKEDGLASATWAGGREQIICNLPPLYTCVLGVRQSQFSTIWSQHLRKSFLNVVSIILRQAVAMKENPV